MNPTWAFQEPSAVHESVEAFEAGLEIDPDNRAARISYARALYLSGRPAAAREALTEAHRYPDGAVTEVREALDEVQGFVGSTPHLAGTHVVDPEHEKLGRALEEGYDFVAFASDMLFFADNMEHVRSSLAHLR